MTNARMLKDYRMHVLELQEVQEHIRQTERMLNPRGLQAHRADTVRGTNDPTAATMQLLDGLEALEERIRQEMSQLQPRIDAMLAQVMDFRLLVILRQYYLCGSTDAEIAAVLNLSDRYVCKLRNGYIRTQEKEEILHCTPSAH
ncbi:MAG: hypothetical protein IJ507_05560 [Clostridia bacterium]|nr:hypothetical protein [Clostridia bacterium]